MIAGTFKTAARRLWNNGWPSIVNVGGLAIGMASLLLMFSFLRQEWNYDRFHGKADRVYRLNIGNIESGAQSALGSGVMGPALALDFPEIEQYVRFKSFPTLVARGEKRFYEKAFFYTDSTLFEVFDFELLQGNPKNALTQPFSLVLTERAAQKYFGAENPLGKSLRIDGQFEYTVTGVVKNPPATAHFGFDYLAPIASLRTHPDLSIRYYQLHSWFSHYYATYLLLRPGTDAAALGERLKGVVKKYAPAQDFERYGLSMGLFLQPLTDIHLNPVRSELEPQGNRRDFLLLGAAALFILLIACANYANLSAALALGRLREMGVRKVLGSSKRQLAKEFFVESLLVSGAALCLAIPLALVGSEPLGQWIGRPINLSGGLLRLGGLVLGVSTLIGFLYPAWIGTKPRAVSIFRGQAEKTGKLSLAKLLVVLQFSLSVSIMIATAVVFHQIHFMRNSPLGLDVGQVVVLPIHQNPAVLQQLEPFQAALRENTGVISATVSELVPGEQIYGFVSKFEGQAQALNYASIPIGYDFFETYGIKMAAGRAFSREFPSDTVEKAIVNQALVRDCGWESAEAAIGKRFDFGNDGQNMGQVIGVVEDFHFRSLKFNRQPIVFFIFPQFFNYISVKIQPGAPGPVLAYLQETWGRFFPQIPFDYFFADEFFGKQYTSDLRLAKLFSIFGGLSVLLSCTGLFGLAFFSIRRQVKEIGIRKVLGASVAGITGLLTKDFLKLVLIAVVIASPIAYFFMQKWLSDFAYRIDIQWWMFAAAGLTAVAIAFLTVSFQSVKAALANPVKSLRSE